MMRNKLAVKLTMGFVMIFLLTVLTISIIFIQMFRQYAFESREKTMLERARSISEVVSEFSQNGPMRGFGGFMHFLDTMSEARVWITDSQGNPAMITGVSRKDEIGQLSSSLDLLASRLNYTIDQLFQEKGKLNDIIASISEGIAAFPERERHSKSDCLFPPPVFCK